MCNFSGAFRSRAAVDKQHEGLQRYIGKLPVTVILQERFRRKVEQRLDGPRDHEDRAFGDAGQIGRVEHVSLAKFDRFGEGL